MIYTFGGKKTSKDATVELAGGKALGLITMSNAGLPVPRGFTITTDVCMDYLKDKASIGIHYDAVEKNIVALADSTKEGYMPLVSVRSGARVSMAGMMDTVLNVGMTYENLAFWKEKLGERAALDCYRRLYQMYGSVVLGIDAALYEKHITSIKKYKYGMKEAPAEDSDMSVKHLTNLIAKYSVFTELPQCLMAQLQGCIEAVFRSWNNDRAKLYRKMHGFSDDWGTAVTIQSMVFGNMNDESCSGVVFTRNPSTGEKGIIGEYLVNAQGEDVVSGTRTPLPFNEMAVWNTDLELELSEMALKLEVTATDMQDIEFTVQDGELFILQTRTGKRSGKAAFKIAHDMYEEGSISKHTALKRVTVKQYYEAIRPTILEAPEEDGKGLPASSGVVRGVAVFNSAEAEASTETCILVRHETTPDDLAGMRASVGVLTATGGVTSHAAVVARGLGKVCVTACEGLDTMEEILNGINIAHGQYLTLCGETGRVWINRDIVMHTTQGSEETTKIFNLALGSIPHVRIKKLVEPHKPLVLGAGKDYTLYLSGIDHLTISHWTKKVCTVLDTVRHHDGHCLVVLEDTVIDSSYYKTLFNFSVAPDRWSPRSKMLRDKITSGGFPTNVSFLDRCGVLDDCGELDGGAPIVTTVRTVKELLAGGAVFLDEGFVVSLGGHEVIRDLISRVSFPKDKALRVLEEGRTELELLSQALA